jgi:hypothetical protein
MLATNWVLVLAGELEVLDRLGKLASTCLHLVEKAHILNGNNSLVGERCHQVELLVGERLNLGPHERKNTNERIRS